MERINKIKMKKKNLWIVLLIVLIAIGILITLITIQKKRDARPFNTYDFLKTLAIENATKYNRADTICLYLAHQILGLDTINLMIANIPEHLNNGEMEFQGMVQMTSFKHNQFLILLNKKNLSFSKLKLTLSHEFIHINQYISGDLIVYPKFAIYKGEKIYFSKTKYKNRPFEKEAFKNQSKIMKKLDKFLYE